MNVIRMELTLGELRHLAAEAEAKAAASGRGDAETVVVEAQTDGCLAQVPHSLECDGRRVMLLW